MTHFHGLHWSLEVWQALRTCAVKILQAALAVLDFFLVVVQRILFSQAVCSRGCESGMHWSTL